MKDKHMKSSPEPPELLGTASSTPVPILWSGAAMRQILQTMTTIRTDDAPILITGETGVGKELIAWAIYKLSQRGDKDFAVINCSSLSKEMLESQLFGHRRGSFTGAVANHPGLLRSLNGGTLFMDEIGDMEPSIQPKLLRFLQNGEVLPLGETRSSYVDVRLIAATNKDLQQEVDEGRFRKDLFYRVNALCIHVPPLRQRRDEIPQLIERYLKYYSERAGKERIVITQETLDILTSYEWPGNIRQLCNELRRMVAFAVSGDVITPETLSPDIVSSKGGIYLGKLLIPQIDVILQEHQLSLSDAVELFEKQLIRRALELHKGLISPTARDLRLTRRGFKLKLKRYNVGNSHGPT
jgi:two-component system response regulator HupR/HoxA